jgi:hypothetical protein
MKIANVAPGQDERPPESGPATETNTCAVTVPGMSDALRRYPRISGEEEQQLIRFLRDGSQEDIVQAAYVAGLEPQLIAFRKDHPEHFPAGLKAWTPLALLVLVPVLAILWHYLA